MKNKENNQFVLNMCSSILAFLINIGLQFIITPILTKQIGDEAYGFITIANDFTSYASIFATILNSVAARYIGVELHKKNNDKAQEYYNSILFGNFIISFVLVALSGIFIWKFDTFLNISSDIYQDVVILFILTFTNYIISIIVSLFSVSAYVSNRLDLTSIRTIISNIIKLVCIIFLFVVLPAVKVYYLAIATILSTIYIGFSNARLSKKLIPELKWVKGKHKLRLIYDLIKTGVWMTVNNLSNVLSGNIVTVLINIYISSSKAGFYSVARTLPNCANSFVYTLYNIFVPTYLKLYAEGKKQELVDYAKFSIKIMTFILGVPFVVVCILGTEFIGLWQSYRSVEEIELLGKILKISMVLIILYTPVLPLSQLGLITNKIKWQTINNLFISVASVVSVYVMLAYTKMELIGITVAMVVVQGLKWISFTPIYAAWVIEISPFTFWTLNVKMICSELIVGLALYIINNKLLCAVNNWFYLILNIIILCFIGYIVMAIMIFNKKDWSAFKNKIKKVRR